MKIFLSLLLVLFLCSCHNQKKAAETKPAEAPPSESVSGDEAASLNNLMVSFYSRGAGINRKAVIELEDFLIEYSRSTNTQIPYKKIAWGKEGEVDFCIPLSNMIKGQREKFLRLVKDILRLADTVHLYENRPCREEK